MSKIPAYKEISRFTLECTSASERIDLIALKMQRAVEILAEIRAGQKSQRIAPPDSIEAEADKLLTELEVQPK